MLAYESEQTVNKEEIIKLYKQGLNAEEIARTLQLTWARVYPIVKRLKKRNEKNN